MKRTILAITLLAVPTLVSAEEPERPFTYKGSYYGYFKVGACVHGYPVVGGGAGGEGFLWRGLTLGVSGGYHKFSGADKGFGLVSLDLGYHFVDRTRPNKVDPFVSFGLLGVAGIPALVNHLGGGLNYWFRERVGLRTEVRLTSLAYDRPFDMGFRMGEAVVGTYIGISFR